MNTGLCAFHWYIDRIRCIDSTVQRGTAQYSAMQCSAVQRNCKTVECRHLETAVRQHP